MFQGVKVFSASKQKERENLGQQVTRWLREQDGKIEIVDREVRQSSDSEYHCISIILFYDFLGD